VSLQHASCNLAELVMRGVSINVGRMAL
jgi:hypothetical protein